MINISIPKGKRAELVIYWKNMLANRLTNILKNIQIKRILKFAK